MEKIYEILQKQSQYPEYKKDAEDCLKIYEKLKEINGGAVWSSQYEILITKYGWRDITKSILVIKPTPVGHIFLDGINATPAPIEKVYTHAEVELLCRKAYGDGYDKSFNDLWRCNQKIVDEWVTQNIK